MAERTRSPHARPTEERRAPERTAEDAERTGWSDTPNRLRLALLLTLVGAAVTVLGPELGLVANAPAAGFSSAPLLVVLVLIAPVLAGVAMLRGQTMLAAGVLIGAALLEPGRALVDLQFATDALLASRPELMVPTSLAPLKPAAGVWVLLAGHLTIAVAGLLAAAAAAAGRAGAELDENDDRARRYLIGWAFACATVATVGLLRPTFRSNDAFLLAPEVIDSPTLARIGGLLVTGAVVLGCVFAASSTRRALTRGVLIGLLAGVLGVTVPGIVAGLAVHRLAPELGPYLAIAALAVLVLVGFLRPRPANGTEDAAELRLESRRLHLAAGVLGLAAGIAAVVGGLGALLVVDAGLEQPSSYANRQLIPAGILVGLLGAALLVGRWAGAVRPAFTVSLASVLLVGAAALDAALTGSGISAAVHVGAGVWFTALAMVLAAAAAGCAALAGGAERDDVDLTERAPNLSVTVPCAAAVLLAIGAFGLPAVKAPDFVAPGIWSEFRLASWGLLLALLVVIAVAVLAPVSRPVRAASLLLGGAALVGVHLLEFPLTSGRAEQATAGQGTWLSLACAGALTAAAIVALVSRPAKS